MLRDGSSSGRGSRFPYATIIGPAGSAPARRSGPGRSSGATSSSGERCVLGNASSSRTASSWTASRRPITTMWATRSSGTGPPRCGRHLLQLRLDQRNVVIHLPEGAGDTGLKKFGAILGDDAEVGCNAVLNPGTLLGPRSLVMPSIAFGGVLAPSTIARVRQQVTLGPRGDFNAHAHRNNPVRHAPYRQLFRRDEAGDRGPGQRRLLYFIADYHSMTTITDPGLRRNTRGIASTGSPAASTRSAASSGARATCPRCASSPG
jgi:hypothetical protein